MSKKYNDDLLIIASIADVHIGNEAISAKQCKYQLKKGVIDKLKLLKRLDGLVICGDLFHKSLSMNGEYATVANWFVNKLVKLCTKHQAFFRIIKGTKSHDLDQLDNFKMYEEYDNNILNFKIINNVEIEELYGCRMAFIPEEYIKESPKKYYREIFDNGDNYFDMIFFHGMVDAFSGKSTPDNYYEDYITAAPTLKVKELCRVCKGPIQAGHVHSRTHYGTEKFFYIGSTLRYAHGEEEDKGFNLTLYLKSNSKYVVEFIKNEYTLNFHQIKITNDDLKNKSIDEIKEMLDEIATQDNLDRCSLKLVCIANDENKEKIRMMTSYIHDHNNGEKKKTDDDRLLMKVNVKYLQENDYLKECNSELYDEKKPPHYLNDSYAVEEQIKMWIKDKKGKDIDIEKIIEVIKPKSSIKNDKSNDKRSES